MNIFSNACIVGHTQKCMLEKNKLILSPNITFYDIFSNDADSCDFKRIKKVNHTLYFKLD